MIRSKVFYSFAFSLSKSSVVYVTIRKGNGLMYHVTRNGCKGESEKERKSSELDTEDSANHSTTRILSCPFPSFPYTVYVTICTNFDRATCSTTLSFHCLFCLTSIHQKIFSRIFSRDNQTLERINYLNYK